MRHSKKDARRGRRRSSVSDETQRKGKTNNKVQEEKAVSDSEKRKGTDNLRKMEEESRSSLGEPEESQNYLSSVSKSDESEQESVSLSGTDISNANVTEGAGNSSISFFSIGTRLEAKDAGSDIWYSAKVVEVDQEEDEVLIHFEKWSQRYDEWVPMDSARLRPVQNPVPSPTKKKTFKIGDKVLATWSDSRKYAATVKNVLSEDRYEVVFYDGFTKIIRGSKMSKSNSDAEEFKQVPLSNPIHSNQLEQVQLEKASKAQPVKSDNSDGLGTKEERRERKRKINVAELFQTRKRNRYSNVTPPHADKRKRKISENQNEKKHEEQEISQERKVKKASTTRKSKSLSSIHSKQQSALAKELQDDVNEIKNAMKKCSWKENEETEAIVKRSSSATNIKQGSEELNHGKLKKKKQQDPDIAPIVEEVPEKWEPEGESAYIVEGSDGPRKSIVLKDPRVPTGWKKHTIQRMSGNSAGKWDIFFESPQGRKFRTRNELRIFYEDKGEDFPIHCFDFSLRQRKYSKSIADNSAAPLTSKIRNSVGRNKSFIEELGPTFPSPQQGGEPKRVKTLLPKVRLPTAATPMPAVEAPVLSPLGDGITVNLSAQKENDAYKCPKEGCNKNFRKENLLQMHIKHYHPEYNKFIGSAPNVADLAYARTIGESLDDILSKPRLSIGSPTFIDKINKFEEKRKARFGGYPMKDKQRLSRGDPGEEDDDSMAKADLTIEHDLSSDANSSLDHAVLTLESTMNEEKKETPGIKTLLPVTRPTSSSHQELSVIDRLKNKLLEHEAAAAAAAAAGGVASTSSASNQLLTTQQTTGVKFDRSRVIRKKQLADFHMEPMLKRRHKTVIKQDLPECTMSQDENSLQMSEFEKTSTAGIKKKIPLVQMEKFQVNADSNDTVELEETKSAPEGRIFDNFYREEIINCTCGYAEEDGLMIQCDLCLCWQHGLCNNIEKEEDVPEKYICVICLNPAFERQSTRYFHNQDWIKEGRLPGFSFRKKDVHRISHHENILKRSHELTGSLLDLQNIIRCVQVRIGIAQKIDNPKLYLWANPKKSAVTNSRVIKEEFQNNLTENVKLFKHNVKQSEISIDKNNSLSLKMEDPIQNEVNPNSFEVDLKSDAILSNSLLIENNDNDNGTLKGTKSESIKEEKITVEEPDEVAPSPESETHCLTIQDKTDQLVSSGKDFHEEDKDSSEGRKAKPLDHATDQLSEGKLTELAINDQTVDNTDLKIERKEAENELELQITQSDLLTIATTIAKNLETSIEPPVVPQPEAPIDFAVCHQNLLEDIETNQNMIESRLTTLEAHITALESEDTDMVNSESPEFNARLKETVQMLLRDLSLIREIAAYP